MNDQSTLKVVALAGELDLARRDELARTLVIDGPGPAILIDFTRVTYADSTAISAMLRFRGEADAAGRRIAMLVANPQFKRVLQYAGLTEAFAVFDDRGAALTYLAQPA